MSTDKIGQIPPIKFERFLLFIGCVYKRQKGSHKVFHRDGLIRPIILPIHSGDIPVFIIRNILRQLNMSVENYLEILKKL